MFNLRSVFPAIQRFQPPLGFYRSSRQIYTRETLQRDIVQLQEGLSILQDVVAHPKAMDILQDINANRNNEYTESTTENPRWIKVARRLNISQRYHSPEELKDTLTQFTPPHIFLPPSCHTTWKILNYIPYPIFHGRHMTGQGILSGLLDIISTFKKHIDILREEPITGNYSLTDPLQPVSYQVLMQDQIKLVVIVVNQLSRPNLGEYTRLFTELYAASQCNTNDFDEDRMPKFSSRVYGLLTDTAQFSFFSYDPITSTFQKDENLYVKPGSMTAPCDTIKVSEKFFSILMYAYNELLDDLLSSANSVPKENLQRISIENHNTSRPLPDLLREAV
ncbi:uncharacterized protein ARMOST_16239 [Armillaria ostoyae]|uniref:Uncharacterized protein n=1 Tax=Armillaria ostoyae TaxID=47428 RepID=A0A284RVM3_ARMOS|nr:uncharacterized protein ARMOST_16239 [Armillaria ostoyae]